MHGGILARLAAQLFLYLAFLSAQPVTCNLSLIMAEFIINGGKPLRGEVRISGSKNAALPILAATLLTSKKCVIKNMPDIEDVRSMLAILQYFGSEINFKRGVVEIQTRRIRKLKSIHDLHELGCKMRASVLLLGPLLARTGAVHLPFPGGCILGVRPIDTHTEVLRQFGVKKMPSKKDEIVFRGRPRQAHVVLPEFSVTATENALMAAALTSGKTEIKLAALEPHVRDLCIFLKKLGVKINGIGSHTLLIRGCKTLAGATHTIVSDYLEAGTFIIAGILTRGNILVKNVEIHDLDIMWSLLCEMGVNFELNKNSVRIGPSKNLQSCKRLQTMAFPGFPTDLQPPFAVLLTQASGESRIHETLFEGRFKYFPDLAKMGAKIEKLGAHEAVVHGGTKLRGAKIKSWDIRAGAAMILAALAAKGRSVVSDIHYIDRGYERFDEKLRKLGADIKRLD